MSVVVSKALSRKGELRAVGRRAEGLGKDIPGKGNHQSSSSEILWKNGEKASAGQSSEHRGEREWK